MRAQLDDLRVEVEALRARNAELERAFELVAQTSRSVSATHRAESELWAERDLSMSGTSGWALEGRAFGDYRPIVRGANRVEPPTLNRRPIEVRGSTPELPNLNHRLASRPSEALRAAA